MLIAVLLLGTLAVAVPVVLTHHGSSGTGKVAPLSAADRQMLLARRPLVDAMATAIAQVPIAASDAARGGVTAAQARETLGRVAALAPLSRAIADPAALTSRLAQSYDAVLAGRRPMPGEQLGSHLGALQSGAAPDGPPVPGG